MSTKTSLSLLIKWQVIYNLPMKPIISYFGFWYLTNHRLSR